MINFDSKSNKSPLSNGDDNILLIDAEETDRDPLQDKGEQDIILATCETDTSGGILIENCTGPRRRGLA
jgi:hypothetical protein